MATSNDRIKGPPQLAAFWRVRSNDQRRIAYAQLLNGAYLWQMPDWWRLAHYSDRWQIIRYLQGTNLLTEEQVNALVVPQRSVDRLDSPYPVTSIPGIKGRMLSVKYTLLTDTWQRGNGIMVKPAVMNESHLENSLKLLNESHGNIVAKACQMLGAIHNQFRAVTGIREYCESLCIQLQKVDVATLYPIFDPMAEELAKRREKTRLPMEDTIDMFNSLMDQEIANWQ